MKRAIYTLFSIAMALVLSVSCDSSDDVLDDLDLYQQDDSDVRASQEPTIIGGKICIYTASELACIGVNSSFPLDDDYVLMNNITLSGTWTPIAPSYDKAFTGTFDGGGNSVSGLSISTGADYQGLFGFISNGAGIYDLTISSPSVRGGDYVAALAAYVEESTIDGCSVVGGSVSGENRVGGVVGTIAVYSEIISCNNSASITCSDNTAGGVAGYAADSPVRWCYNTGSISYGSHLGGVVGWTHSAPLLGCYNTGAVSGTSECGGVVGSNFAPYAIVYACYNTGRVSGTYRIGGIIGLSMAPLYGCYNTGVVWGSSESGNIAGYSRSSNGFCYYIAQDGSYVSAAGVGSGSGNGTVILASSISDLNSKVDDINDADSGISYFTTNDTRTDIQNTFGIKYADVYYVKGNPVNSVLPTIVER